MAGISRKNRGFTIVELAVVIAIIALLATVTLVVYNGAQDRAREARLTTAITQYRDIFKIYKTNNGDYPLPSSGTGVGCIGEPYPAITGFPSNACYMSGSTVVVSVDTTLNAALKDIAGQLPPITDAPKIDIGDTKVRGILYQYGGEYTAIILYRVGDKPCAIGFNQYLQDLNLTACTIYINE